MGNMFSNLHTTLEHNPNPLEISVKNIQKHVLQTSEQTNSHTPAGSTHNPRVKIEHTNTKIHS